MVHFTMANNQDMVELWNSDASASWSTSPERYDAMLGPVGERALDTVALQPGDRVLDVGCGAGQLSLQAAERVGPTGAVLGVDVSADLVAVCRQRAAAAGLSNVQVLEADAQEHAFEPATYDAVVSRFGVMFFADPAAAFRNLRAATAPGGRLAFVAWQAPPFNEWLMVPLGALVPHLGMPDLPAPGAPGPFSFGDQDRVREVLAEAGWTAVEVEDVQTTLSIGGARTAEEAVDFTLSDTFGRLLMAKATPEQRTAAETALREAYASHVGPDGLRLNAAVWLVTARRD